jgi:hypothetical protein
LIATGRSPHDGQMPEANRRRPRGYRGVDHETVGSDLVSILHCLKFPEQVLGADEFARLKQVDPSGWYPIQWLLDLMDTLGARVGHYGLIAMGRSLFKLSHEEQAKKVLKSAHDVIHGLDGMYHHANRGTDIGGWKVVRFQKGLAELEKTTPHHCVMEQGILSAAFDMVGCPAMITQPECFRSGAELCRYSITSVVTDQRWS